ncbi:MAG: lipoyl synthase [Candidatus Omnitrophota bacterium]
MPKPPWLKKKINLNELRELSSLFKDLKLNTVCQEAACPNISECFSKKTATFLILGDICTRNCKFCGVKKGLPGEINPSEPENIAKAIEKLGLKHVVITSVTRDDLDDGGAEVFVSTVGEIRKISPAKIELLVPDFNLNKIAIKKIVNAKPEIIGHNLETVPRLYNQVRENADYKRSLELLRMIKILDEIIHTKSGLMLGLGEAREEVINVLKDLRKIGCEFLSLGQYLAPSKNHFPVKEYISQEEFNNYRKIALDLGFKYVASSPYVRSSYMAEKYIINDQ